MNWYGIKVWLETASGLNMDALHVHAGLLVQLGAALILRRSLKSPLPWLVVPIAILANEIYDLTYEIWPTRGAQIGQSIKDIWNTMLVPTLLLVTAWIAPWLLIGGASAKGNADRMTPAPQQAQELGVVQRQG
jgi:hypothetical protein